MSNVDETMKKRKKNTVKKKNKSAGVVGYYWDGAKSWVLSKKRSILSI